MGGLWIYLPRKNCQNVFSNKKYDPWLQHDLRREPVEVIGLQFLDRQKLWMSCDFICI